MNWEAIATVGAGLLALAGAGWTIYAPRRAAYKEKLEIELAIAKRIVAVLEVTRGGIKERLKGKRCSTIPWTAFDALTDDVGVLDINTIRRYVMIESLGRDERAAAKANDDAEELRICNEIDGRCNSLLHDCQMHVDRLEGVLAIYYRHRLRNVMTSFTRSRQSGVHVTVG